MNVIENDVEGQPDVVNLDYMRTESCVTSDNY